MAGVAAFESQVVSVADIDAGALVYQPPENETGTGYRGFSFRVHDSGGTSAGGVNIDPTANQINFDLPGVNDPPLLLSNGATVAEGDAIIIDSTMLYGADSDDPNPDDLVVTVTRLPAHGELTVAGSVVSVGDQFTLQSILDEALRYEHDESETSADQFGVSLRDGGEDGAQSADGNFELSITEVIDPAPVVTPDELLLAFGQSFNSLSGDVLASGFSGLNGDAFIASTQFNVSLEEAPSHGAVVLNQDGTFIYEHDGSRIYKDQFSYRVTNEDGIFTIATVSIVIEPPVNAAFGSETEMPGADADETEAPQQRPVPEAGKAKPNKPSGRPPAEISSATAQSFTPVFGRTIEATRDSDVAAFFELRNIQVIEGIERPLYRDTADITAVTQHNKSEILKGSGLQPVGVSITEIIFDVYVPTAREVVDNPYFIEGLRDADEAIEEARPGQRYAISEELVLGASLSMSIGLVSWALRGGAVFASLMTAGPLWWGMDITKVAVPSSTKEKEPKTPREDNQKLEGMFD